jgi:MOSC domain-containing protein YiiM
VRAGDAIRKLLTHPAEVPVCEITRVYTQDKDDAPALRRLLAVDVLPPDWRTIFEKQLQKVTA